MRALLITRCREVPNIHENLTRTPEGALSGLWHDVSLFFLHRHRAMCLPAKHLERWHGRHSRSSNETKAKGEASGSSDGNDRSPGSRAAPFLRHLGSSMRAHNLSLLAMTPHGLSVREQFRAIASADVIIYFHGSAHANFFVASPRTLLIELTPYFIRPGEVLARCEACGQKRADASCYTAPPRVDAIDPDRSQSLQLGSMLSRMSVPVRHIAIPAGLIPVDSFNGSWRKLEDWGCLPPSNLARLTAHELVHGLR